MWRVRDGPDLTRSPPTRRWAAGQSREGCSTLKSHTSLAIAAFLPRRGEEAVMLESRDQRLASWNACACRARLVFECEGQWMIGKPIFQYELLEELGTGAKGSVHRARDTNLERDVAIRVLPRTIKDDATAFDRFRLGARAAMALDHPNICGTYGLFIDDGQWYMVMELMDLLTLKELPAELSERGRQIVGSWGPLFEFKIYFRLAMQLADALHAAHTMGLVHGRIRPTNIHITRRGDPKIVDFGLAGLSPMAMPQALSGESAGISPAKAPYLSPEQVRRETLDSRSDLFSLGSVLYAMGTGRQAFSGGDAAAILRAIAQADPPNPCQLCRELPDELGSTIARMLEEDPARRHQRASVVKRELEHVWMTTGSWRKGPIVR